MKCKFLIAVLIISTFSCSKFEDGPAISFRSKENRLIGNWKLVKWVEKGADVTESNLSGGNVFYQFDENRSMLISYNESEVKEGTWLLEETNVIMDIQMVSEVGNYIDKDTLMLKRLTNKEMVVYFDNQLETEWFFEAQ